MTTKLLAVDDSKTMQKVLEITFAGDTYDSTVVGSTAEALQALGGGAPQIAVVDAHLGTESGYDLARQIKEQAPGVKVLLLSSKQRPYDEGAGSAAGVDAHFDKPFDSGKFLDALGQLDVSAPVAAAAPAPRPASPPMASVRAAPPQQAPAPAPVVQEAPPAQRPQAPPSRVASAAPVAQPVAQQVRPAPVAAPAFSAQAGDMRGKLEALGLSSDQVSGVLSLSRDVVEQVVWEVVPALAETLIKEEIARLTRG